MRLHLDALILLQRVWAGFGLVAAASLVTLGVGAALALDAAGSLGQAERGSIWILGICAALLLGGAGGALAAARGLRRREPSGRLAALALAVPNLILVPFGTALGVYTLWVLLNNDARREFGRPPRGPEGSSRVRGRQVRVQ